MPILDRRSLIFAVGFLFLYGRKIVPRDEEKLSSFARVLLLSHHSLPSFWLGAGREWALLFCQLYPRTSPPSPVERCGVGCAKDTRVGWAGKWNSVMDHEDIPSL